MGTNLEKLDNFLSSEGNFIEKLRFLEGLDKRSLDEFLFILDDIGKQIREHKFIEKRLAFLLVEVCPILMSISSQYQGAELKEVTACIADVSAKISHILE